MFDLPALEEAAHLIHGVFPPTPQYAWPLLAERAGCEVWVKHENHTPTGAFKVRGGLNLVGGLIGSLIWKSPDGKFHTAGWIMSILGAMILLWAFINFAQ